MHLMITNGGPHPAERWADLTCANIMGLIQIEATAPPARTIEKREFELKLAKLLIDLHRRAQQLERDALKHKGDDHLLSPINPLDMAKAAAIDVAGLTKGTSFEEHFAKPDVQIALANMIGQHFANSIHVERSWHADSSPDSPASKAYKSRHQ